MVREHPFKALGIDDFFALIRGHAAQIVNSLVHQAPPVRGKLPHLAEDLARLLLLFRGQMLPGFHAVQHLQLLLRRETRKALEPLP